MVVTTGLTVIAVVVALLFHKYVPPPLAVTTLLCPTQIDDGEATAAALGSGFTVTVVEADAVHPNTFVTVTV